MRYGTWTAYWFLLPTLAGLVIFRLIPIGVSFLASFTRWNIYAPPQWIGVNHYREIWHSGEFWLIARNTVQFSLMYTAGVCVLGLVFAVFLNEKLRGITFFRGLFFLPVITSVVAVGLVWSWILSPQYGALNQLLGYFTDWSEPPSWLGDSRYALYSLTVVYIWKTVGYQMIIYLAGLQQIPAELREAAKIDGAGSFRSFFRVTLPLLSPTVFFVLIITIIDSFNTFGITYAMTQGGPYQSTTTLAYAIYQNAFVHFRMGYASGLAYVLFLFTAVIAGVHFLLKNKWVSYQ